MLLSLDNQYSPQKFANVETYATQFAKQLKPLAAVIVNGKPIVPEQPSMPDVKLEFQKKWLVTPQTNHQLTSFDCHLIPGTGTFIVNASGKVRFDESGKNRLGENANLVQSSTAPVSNANRNIWGSWFGYDLTLVVDENVRNNDEMELINSFNYRFTFKPRDSVIQI